MADTGLETADTVVEDNAIGTTTWTNPTYAKTEDGSYASAVTSTSDTA